MTVYDFSVKDRKGNAVSLGDYAGKVLLIVNTAMGCGFTPREGERRFSLARGRWLIWLGGAGSTALGLFLARDPASLLLWSRKLIPALSLAAALLLPGLCALGIARKKL